MAQFRLPNITGVTEKEQLEQMKKYMFQLSRELNYALRNTEAAEYQYKQSQQRMGGNGGTGGVEGTGGNGSTNTSQKGESALETFERVKDLIIKSADIIDAYSEEIDKKLKGSYVAVSDFGTYKDETEAYFKATSENFTQNYTSKKELQDTIDGLDQLRNDTCYIKTGWLDDMETIAGVEIGKYSESIEGSDVGFARFTTDELVFYDGQGTNEENKLAWFSKYRSHFRNVTIIGNIELDDNYILDTSDGLAFKWAGDS